MKIYVASSWRNKQQQELVRLLREDGHDVYDFRNQESAFSWSQIASWWRNWTARDFIEALSHPLARRGYASDMRALTDCNLCILLLPCGRSAHLELGFASGRGTKTAILMDNGYEPELTYLMADYICTTTDELRAWIKNFSPFTYGQAGVRDPQFPCGAYRPGKPGLGSKCEGDGHYLCSGCTERKPDEPEDDINETAGD